MLRPGYVALLACGSKWNMVKLRTCTSSIFLLFLSCFMAFSADTNGKQSAGRDIQVLEAAVTDFDVHAACSWSQAAGKCRCLSQRTVFKEFARAACLVLFLEGVGVQRDLACVHGTALHLSAGANTRCAYAWRTKHILHKSGRDGASPPLMEAIVTLCPADTCRGTLQRSLLDRDNPFSFSRSAPEVKIDIEQRNQD